MKLAEFRDGMERLFLVFDPKGWTEQETREKLSAEYWSIFHWLSAEQWTRTITTAQTDCDKMPTPKQLLSLSGAKTKSQHRNLPAPTDTCENCTGGRIYFTAIHPTSGIKYERYAACDCEYGTRMVQHIQALENIKNGKRPPDEFCRYSFLFGQQSATDISDAQRETLNRQQGEA